MIGLKLVLVVISILCFSCNSTAFFPGTPNGEYSVKKTVDTNIDLIHGRMLVIGKYLYHGTFDNKAWIDDSYQCAAILYKRDAETLDIISRVQFFNDGNHRNIVDIQYSPNQHRIYVLFMGGRLVSLDPESLGWVGLNSTEDICKSEMGKVVVSPLFIYRVSQTYPQTIVTQYSADNGIETGRITLDIPAGHGGLYSGGSLYVTTSQNDPNGSFIYLINAETLEVLSRHRILDCANIAPDFAIIRNHLGYPYLVFGCEGYNQDSSAINNLYIADAYWPSNFYQYKTNENVLGGILGVSAADNRVYVSRGSDPATIESVNPWNGASVFYKLDGLAGCNGGVDIVGNRIYFKVFPQFLGYKKASSIGYLDFE